MKKMFVFSVLLASLIFAVSCSSKKKSEEKKAPVVKEEVAQEISAEEGGTIKNSDESVSIEIPGNALENDTKITMKIYDAKDYKGTDDKDVISKVVEFEPSGTVFKKPVIITMKSLKDVENKIITAAVFREEKGKWSYSPKGAAVKIAGYDEGGDPIMQSAGGDPIMLSAGGDPIMMDAGGDPIMLSAGGDPIMITAGGDPIMQSAGGDPIMMTTGHFTAYAFIALETNSEETPDNEPAETEDKDDSDTPDSEITDKDEIADGDNVEPDENEPVDDSDTAEPDEDEPVSDNDNPYNSPYGSLTLNFSIDQIANDSDDQTSQTGATLAAFATGTYGNGLTSVTPADAYGIHSMAAYQTNSNGNSVIIRQIPVYNQEGQGVGGNPLVILDIPEENAVTETFPVLFMEDSQLVQIFKGEYFLYSDKPILYVVDYDFNTLQISCIHAFGEGSVTITNVGDIANHGALALNGEVTLYSPKNYKNTLDISSQLDIPVCEPVESDDPSDPTEPGDDPDPTNPEGCQLDVNILNSDAERYFAFKGTGTINETVDIDPFFASLVKTSLVGFDGKDLDYAQHYSFFFSTTQDTDIPVIALRALGDPNMSTGLFSTIAYAYVSIDSINIMKENEVDRLPTAPDVKIFDIIYTSDSKYAKHCLIGRNKYGFVEELGEETALGTTQVCYNNNVDFSVGEEFKLAMVAELIVGQEIIDADPDIETIDDLCTCYDYSLPEDDPDYGKEIDCSEIAEFYS